MLRIPRVFILAQLLILVAIAPSAFAVFDEDAEERAAPAIDVDANGLQYEIITAEDNTGSLGNTASSDAQPGFSKDRFIVKLRSSTAIDLNSVYAFNANQNVRLIQPLTTDNSILLLSVPAGQSVQEIIETYNNNPNVEYAEPDYIVSFDITPDDTSFSSLWGLNNTGQTGGTADADINAVEAWDITTGSHDVIVAVVDSGVDYNHSDLIDNMWINPGEIAGNGIDDDANGYVDDVHGINAIANSGDPMDDNGHGTHVAGTIGATGNNSLGVAGVNWNVSIIGCKFLDENGDGFASDAVQCLDYLLTLKTRPTNPVDILLSNNSWGAPFSSQSIRDSIEAHQNADMLFVAAAGNVGGNDNDSFPHYPSSYDLSNIIAVAATDDSDQLATFSSFGAQSVDVGAPGVGILSTVPTGSCELCNPSGYNSISGTSMASPHVAGLAALAKAQDSSLTPYALRNLILSSGESIGALDGITATGKRIRAADVDGVGALTCNNQVLAKPLSPATDTLYYGAGDSITLQYLNINCGLGGGSVEVTVEPGGTTVTLQDNGAAPDLTADDGIYSAQFTPAAEGSITFPSGEVVTLKEIKNYRDAVPVPYNYRTLSPGATQLTFINPNTVAITYTSPPIFPIELGGIEPGLDKSLTFGRDGYISFDRFLPWFNTELPVSNSNVVALFWDSLRPHRSTLFDGVYFDVQGSAPSRELIVEWRRVPHDESFNVGRFQMVFFEGKSDILFNYADVDFDNPTVDNGASATVGVQSHTNLANQYSFNSPSLSDGTALLWELDALLAKAGDDLVANYGEEVNLDGSASSDNNGTIVSYAWAQSLGSPVILNNADTASPSFTAPGTSETLEFTLTVTDNDGNTATDEVRVRINTPPTANAGPDRVRNFGEGVPLYGNSSFDSDGSIEQYEWEQLSGTPVMLNSTAVSNPFFTAPDVAGTLVFQLTVMDNDGATSTDTVNVRVNDPPVADAGADSVVSPGATVNLDASASSDSDGTISFYSWTQTKGDPVTISASNSAVASFTAPSSGGALQFQVKVTDNDGAIDTAEVNISAGGLPFAEAGSDQAVNFDEAVQLDGSRSFDIDGSVDDFSWEQQSGASVSLSDLSSPTPTFVAPSTAGNLIFQLTVTDNLGNTATDSVTIRVNDPPTSNAGSDQVVTLGAFVQLNGSGSSDNDGSIMSYNWVQTAGTPVTLSSTTATNPSFSAPSVSGTLTFELTVTDDDGATSAANSVNIVVGSAPIANAGENQIVDFSTTVNLDGSGSSDSDGSIVSYAWQQTGGSVVALSNTNSVAPSFTAPAGSSLLTFRLTVTDDFGLTSSDSVAISVTAAPIADAGPDSRANRSALVSLDGSASSDADGFIAAYSWSQTGGTSVTLSDANIANPTFTAPLESGTTLSFELTVTDNLGASSSDTVDVVTNIYPLPTTEPDQTVSYGEVVTLDGTGSSDADGTIESFTWSQRSGTSVTLFDANTATATFSAPNSSGDLVFELRVQDNDGAMSVSPTTITVNGPVAADAGPDQVANPTETVTLDGTGTSNKNAAALTFSWAQTDGPESVAIQDKDAASATFVAPETSGDYRFGLVVVDELGAISMDSTTVYVNSLPQAEAGSTKTVTTGQTVGLAGSATDSDGSIIAYQWRQVSGTPIALEDESYQYTNFTAPNAATTIVLELTAIDNYGGIGVDTLTVNVTVPAPASSGGGGGGGSIGYFGFMFLAALALLQRRKNLRTRFGSVTHA